jgi:hypothetical protein
MPERSRLWISWGADRLRLQKIHVRFFDKIIFANAQSLHQVRGY